MISDMRMASRPAFKTNSNSDCSTLPIARSFRMPITATGTNAMRERCSWLPTGVALKTAMKKATG